MTRTMTGLLMAALILAGPARAADKGQELYGAKCASCHAKDGKGSPAMAKIFKEEPSELDLTKASTKSQKDEDLTSVVLKGRKKMPAFEGKLTPEDIASVLAYVRSGLGGGAEDPFAKLYSAKCASCHGKDGKGSAAMSKVFKVEPAALDLTTAGTAAKSDDDLAGLTAKGKDKMPAFEGKLKPEEIKGLVAYMRTLAPAKKAEGAAPAPKKDEAPK